jgi:hypothetical protein
MRPPLKTLILRMEHAEVTFFEPASLHVRHAPLHLNGEERQRTIVVAGQFAPVYWLAHLAGLVVSVAGAACQAAV